MDGPLDLPHLDKGPRDALPIVLVHGFPLDHAMWAPQVHALEAAGHRVIAPDLRGLGRGPLAHSALMQDHVADIMRMVDRAGVRRFALAGFSMGGYVALELAREHADRLAGLALVDTRAEPDSPEAARGRLDTAAKVRAQGSQIVADSMLSRLFTPAAPDAVKQQTYAIMAAQRPDGVAACLLGMAERPDQRPTLARIHVPTLVIVGAADTITPPDAAQALASGIAGARLLVVPDAAHLTTLEQPDVVNAAMVEWAAKLG